MGPGVGAGNLIFTAQIEITFMRKLREICFTIGDYELFSFGLNAFGCRFFSKKVRWDCVSPDDPNMRVTYYGKGQANVLKEGFLTPGSYPVKVVDQNTVTGQNRFGENFTCTRPSENE
ncbi:MAG: hypothetical protein P8Z33_09260 [Gammaproteobacteria bacterium]